MTKATDIERVLATVKALPGRASVCREPNGLVTVWLRLADRTGLPTNCRTLKAVGARLSMITAMPAATGAGHLIAYHFDLAGSTVTIEVAVAPGEAVETIVPIFRNADWHEREFIEFYDIAVTGRATSRSLFLEPGDGARSAAQLIPLSMLANAASTKMLWERLNESKEAQ